MPKSNRRKKQERAKAAVRRAVTERKRTRAAQARVAELMRERINDPGTPAGELAELLPVQYEGGPVGGWLARVLIEHGSSLERLGEAARLMRAAEPDAPSLTALTFAASVARLAGDPDEDRRLTDAALAAADEADKAGEADGSGELRLGVIRFILTNDHHAEAAELLGPYLRETPDDEWLIEQFGVAMERVYETASELPAEDTVRERALLARFADRSGLTALRDAVDASLEGTDLGQAVVGQVADMVADTEDIDWPPQARAGFAALARETALLAVTPDDEEDGEDYEDDDGASTALRVFAADPATPPALVTRAEDWYKHIHYGLWKPDNQSAAPGIWCTDIVTSARCYVEFPADAVAGLPRWAVWLGGVLPVDGIWRSTGAGVWLSPAEADAAAEYVDRAAIAVMAAMAGAPGAVEPRPMRFGMAEPRGVHADDEDAGEPEFGKLMSQVTSAVATDIVAEVCRHRAAPPRLHNTDGDQTCLITASITVTGGLAERLAAHPDFAQDEDDPSRITWYGLTIPDAQREAMMAEAVAQLRAQGHPAEPGPPEQEQRWERGTLHVRDRAITVAVNSRERLARLVKILDALGGDPVVTGEKRVDPGLDFFWAGESRAFPRNAAPAAAGWEKYWLQESVPALDDLTPRQAASGTDEQRMRLEGLLRQFEYEADLLAAEGKTGIDTGWLREELGMKDELAD